MNKTSEEFLHLKKKFPHMSDAKLEEGVLIGSDIRKLIRDRKSENYEMLMENMLSNFKNMGVSISVEIHMLDSHLDSLAENLGAVSDEHEPFNRSWDDIGNLPAEQRAEALKEFMRVRELEQNTHLRNAYDTIIGIHNHTSVQSALNNIPAYHGTTPLKDFVQDIENYRDTIPTEKEQEFLRSLITKIRGEARKCLTNEDIQSVDELIMN
ncbi:hypothetical protein QAD02_002304 [Eretmocerus hayati]|uniref:Uncharacterized protein n=1 Tax=Eretmocerus hayati TaxID=131215 RepID=A0ACC2NIQ2_9HYME|nr:hypothetical protein QAD02_002304 [Eretmocerus hayati]